MLRSIFYARFHSERGPVILRQCPQDATLSFKRDGQDDSSDTVQFGDISNYIIPPYELCNTPLSITVNGSSALGLPVSIEHPKYPRNRFTFNVCYVLDEGLTESERKAWDAVVSKTAAWFKCIEVEQEILSSIDEATDLTDQDVETDAISKMLRQVFEQLQERQECSVQLSKTYVLNLRLDVADETAKPHVHAWDVPLLVAELPDRDLVSWDLVLEQIYPHINGINHVKRISELADAELELVQHAVGNLIAAGTAITLDIFHFQAVYAPTQALAWFLKDQLQINECCEYVASDRTASVTVDDLLDFYLSFQQGVTVAKVCVEHAQLLTRVDIRRLVTFGVIKGILRRIHKYARLPQQHMVEPPVPAKNPYEDAVKNFEQAWKQAALSSGWATPPATLPASIKAKAHKSVEEARREEDDRLRSYLDGKHCFDQICVETGMTEKALDEKIKTRSLGEATSFSR